jgi:hypothetical protein
MSRLHDTPTVDGDGVHGGAAGLAALLHRSTHREITR